MPEAARKMDTPAGKWTEADFFAWQERQPDRYELVNGVAVRMMAGASNRHDSIVVNIIVELGSQLRGRRGRPFTADSSVQTLPGHIRRPDAGVDCGPFEPEACKASHPQLVVEVLSPTTRDTDTVAKLGEYQAVESLEYLLFVEPNLPKVTLWSRTPKRCWQEQTLEGLHRTIELPAIGVTLAMADIYDRIEFLAPPPRLRPRDEGDTII